MGRAARLRWAGAGVWAVAAACALDRTGQGDGDLAAPTVAEGGQGGAPECSTPPSCPRDRDCPGDPCAEPLPEGAPCSAPSDCASGFCADRVCCDAACEG